MAIHFKHYVSQLFHHIRIRCPSGNKIGKWCFQIRAREDRLKSDLDQRSRSDN